jgi:maltooligosyltrehalose trehalohydrolase
VNARVADRVSTAGAERGDFIGAEWVDGVARFRVWAPQARLVEVVFDDDREPLPMRHESNGYFTATDCEVSPGTRYRYQVDGAEPWPDPCSRYQPDGPHASSMLINPRSYAWSDAQWRGIGLRGQVIYELHIGTFTPEGTFDAACERLEYLLEVGVTVIEVMPVAECPGRWNWGYDGVQIFAPYHVYGDHEAFKRFVDRAHQLGLAVILDVVYNHLGPDGNYLRCFSEDYFSKRYSTEWGEPFNVDGDNADGVRNFLLENACYWIREFHLDGFRLDATQSIFDASPTHIVAELVRAARRAAGERQIIVIAENEPQCAEHLRQPEQGGFGLDAMWNDDYHHAARVALTGSRDGYFHDYRGSPQELISAIRHGFLYQGQYYHWQRKRRGSPLPRTWDASACVIFLQNHDQVANTFTGTRCHELASAARLRALTALTLLAPQTPMLFMGEEFGARTPFMYFADHHGQLNQAVHRGRREFVAQFRSAATAEVQALVPDPRAESTFARSKLDWSAVHENSTWLRLHRDLLRLRREDPVIAQQDVSMIEGAVLGSHVFLLRWFCETHGDRLLLVNTGGDCLLAPAPEPLLAPPPQHAWHMIFSSSLPAYGGVGAPEPVSAAGEWRIASETTCLLIARARPEEEEAEQ